MRTYINITYDKNRELIELLQALSSPFISTDEYRQSFYLIGKALGYLLKKSNLEEFGNTMLACASEDADWLASGVLDTLDESNVSLSVFWNERITVNRNLNLDISPIVRSYIEPISTCKTLIIVKSIISTSCVVKTQINHLIGKIEPQKIYILAPVMYKDAQKSLIKEFPYFISEKFVFLTFAIDTVRDEKGCIRPGIGGMVYPRLGLGDSHNKNKYIPEIVKRRMSLL